MLNTYIPGRKALGTAVSRSYGARGTVIVSHSAVASGACAGRATHALVLVIF